jgi:hypothetical protein
MMLELAGQAMDCGGVSSALTGWVECPGEDKLECMMMLAEKTVNFAD